MICLDLHYSLNSNQSTVRAQGLMTKHTQRNHAIHNVLGRTYWLDSNAFIELVKDPSPATPMGFLVKAYREGWINISGSSNHTVHWCLDTHVGIHPFWRHKQTRNASITYLRSFIQPSAETKSTQNDLRDGVRISTALRYGGSAFVTNDKGIFVVNRRSSIAFSSPFTLQSRLAKT